MKESPAPVSRLAIPNQLEALRPMSAWLDGTIRQLAMPEPLLFKFDLCANEAVTNIISYAYADSSPHEIVLRLFQERDGLCLEIEDDGRAFNPIERPRHEQPGSLDDAQIGGLGVDLIRSFMTECHYARRDGRNILKLMARIGE